MDMASKTVHGNRRQHLAQEFPVVVTDRGKAVTYLAFPTLSYPQPHRLPSSPTEHFR